MRAIRTMLLAIAALTMMAMAASTASAQVGPDLEISSEGVSHVHCPAVATPSEDVVTGGCLIHATSNGQVILRRHVFGVESTLATCDNEFHGRVDEHGEGWIIEQKLTKPIGACERIPCDDETTGAIEPWPAHGKETGTPEGLVEGREYLTTNFCVEAGTGGADESCEIDVPFNKQAGNHTYEFGHNPGGVISELSGHGVSGFRCELVGHWISETGSSSHGTEQEVEVDHWTEPA